MIASKLDLREILYRRSRLQYTEFSVSSAIDRCRNLKARGCATARAHTLSLIRLYPRKFVGIHKARASAELNQIRSAKRSTLGSAFRARKRDSAATFPIILPYGVPTRGVTRPASLVFRVYTCSRNPDAPAEAKRETRGGGGGGGGRNLNPCTPKSGTRLWVAYVLSSIIRTHHFGAAW